MSKSVNIYNVETRCKAFINIDFIIRYRMVGWSAKSKKSKTRQTAGFLLGKLKNIIKVREAANAKLEVSKTTIKFALKK